MSLATEEERWGFDEGFARSVRPLLDLLYGRWWRVATEGADNVPARGPALIVANRAGIVPWDALMIATALQREHRAPRPPRFLVDEWAFEMPFVSMLARKLGGVPASPHNALALLREGHVVIVFPEAGTATTKSWRDRYRLARFGRGGFVRLALRTGAPIVPCAVVGGEEAHPRLGTSRRLGRLIGVPGLPLTPTFPWLGPLGLVPLPARWRIELCPPLDLGAYGPDAADDRALALEVSEAVRQQIQAKVHENVVKREGVLI